MSILLNKVLAELKQQRNYDFSGYRTTFLERRLADFMSQIECREPADYLERLAADPAECDRLAGALMVNVSCFFRNPIVFEILAQSVLPELIERKRRRGQRELRLWSAGCGMGEEAYSVAILLDRLLRGEDPAWSLHLFASDVNPDNLLQAGAAIYPVEHLENVRLGQLNEYFTPLPGERWRLESPLRGQVRFCLDDLTARDRLAPSESVFGSFDLVLCRNVLIYFESETQQFVLDKLYRSLAPRGYLVLGEAESFAAGPQFRVRTVDALNRIYQKFD